MRDSFILYTSFYEPLKYLNDSQMGRLFRAIFEYEIDGNIDVENDIRIAFEFIKNQLDIDAGKWETEKQKKSEAGRIGGIKRAVNNGEKLSSTAKQNQAEPSTVKQNQAEPSTVKQSQAQLSTVKQSQAQLSTVKQSQAQLSTVKQSQANQAVNVNVNENENVNVNENVNYNIPVSEQSSTTDGTAKASKHKYGEFKHVLLKDEELQALKRDYQNWEELITFLDEYIEMKGYKAKSHYLCIKKWVVDAVRQKNLKQVNNAKVKNAYHSEIEQDIDLDKFYLIDNCETKF